MSIVPLPRRRTARRPAGPGPLVEGHSIEAMPRTLARLDRIGPIGPAGRQVFIAPIDGTPIADMVGAAARPREAGVEPVTAMAVRGRRIETGRDAREGGAR